MRRRNNIAAGEGRREEGDGFSPLPARNPKKETTGGGGGGATNEENVARKKTEVQHAILPTAIEPVANFLTQCLCWFAIAYAILEINDDLKVSEIWDPCFLHVTLKFSIFKKKKTLHLSKPACTITSRVRLGGVVWRQQTGEYVCILIRYMRYSCHGFHSKNYKLGSKTDPTPIT